MGFGFGVAGRPSPPPPDPLPPPSSLLHRTPSLPPLPPSPSQWRDARTLDQVFPGSAGGVYNSDQMLLGPTLAKFQWVRGVGERRGRELCPNQVWPNFGRSVWASLAFCWGLGGVVGGGERLRRRVRGREGVENWG